MRFEILLQLSGCDNKAFRNPRETGTRRQVLTIYGELAWCQSLLLYTKQHELSNLVQVIVMPIAM